MIHARSKVLPALVTKLPFYSLDDFPIRRAPEIVLISMAFSTGIEISMIKMFTTSGWYPIANPMSVVWYHLGIRGRVPYLLSPYIQQQGSQACQLGPVSLDQVLWEERAQSLIHHTVVKVLVESVPVVVFAAVAAALFRVHGVILLKSMIHLHWQVWVNIRIIVSTKEIVVKNCHIGVLIAIFNEATRLIIAEDISRTSKIRERIFWSFRFPYLPVMALSLKHL